MKEPGRAKEMTTIQRQALQKMDDMNCGAIRINGRWVWREDIRNSEKVAQEVLNH